MPPIWSVESDDPNLAAVLERLVDIKKGNTLVRGPGLGLGSYLEDALREGDTWKEDGAVSWTLGADFLGELLAKRQRGRPVPAPGLVQ